MTSLIRLRVSSDMNSYFPFKKREIVVFEKPVRAATSAIVTFPIQHLPTLKSNFFNNTNGVFSKTKIKYTVFDNELKKPIKGTSVTNEEGYIYISLPEFKTPDIQRRIDVRFDDKQYTYDRTFFIPNFSKDFHVDFLPEGGELLNTTNQIIAFKALGSDGFSKEITGVILKSSR